MLFMEKKDKQQLKRPASLLNNLNPSYKGVSITFWQKILALTIKRGEEKEELKKL